MEKISFGNTFLGVVIGIVLWFIFFQGNPDVVDCIRAIFIRWAGISL